MKEKITWKDAHLFEYINEIEFLYIPDMDDYKYRINIETSKSSVDTDEKKESPIFGYSEIVTIFKNRYNGGELLKQNLYKNYVDEVGYLLRVLELDIDKFWCLYLFAFDFCYSLFYQGVTMKATPLEQLQELVDMINSANGEMMQLNFKFGKNKVRIESPIALKFLADAIQSQLVKSNDEEVKILYKREIALEEKDIADSPIIVYFAKILLNFFDTQEQVRNKRKKGAKHSFKEIDLVSKLIYFSGLSKNTSWLDAENETLKAFLKQYKDYKYPNTISCIYPEFVVY